MAEHHCHGFVMACMDWRIQKAVDELLAHLKVELGNFDRVTVAGGAGNTGLLWYHLDLSQRLHQPDTFILTAHEDCGAGVVKEDLVTNMRRVRAELPEEDTVRGFWIFQKPDGTWGWEEVFI